MRNFNEWLKKRKMDGGMGGMGSPGGAPAGGMPGGSPGGNGDGPPMDGGGDDGNGDGNGHDHDHDHHHHSFLGWPWWYGNRTSKKKDCKYGERKDGKCRKKKK